MMSDLLFPITADKLFEAAGIAENGEQKRNQSDDGSEPLTETQEIELEMANLAITSRFVSTF